MALNRRYRPQFSHEHHRWRERAPRSLQAGGVVAGCFAAIMLSYPFGAQGCLRMQPFSYETACDSRELGELYRGHVRIGRADRMGFELPAAADPLIRR
jgi:hypothetical protein